MFQSSPHNKTPNSGELKLQEFFSQYNNANKALTIGKTPNFNQLVAYNDYHKMYSPMQSHSNASQFNQNTSQHRSGHYPVRYSSVDSDTSDDSANCSKLKKLPPIGVFWDIENCRVSFSLIF